MAERPTANEVVQAIALVHHDDRKEPYPYWCDEGHVLAAEVLALLEQVLALRIALADSIKNDDAACNEFVLKLPAGWEEWP